MGALSCSVWDLVSRTRPEPWPPALGAQNLSPSLTREVPPILHVIMGPRKRSLALSLSLLFFLGGVGKNTIPFPRRSSWARDRTQNSRTVGGRLYRLSYQGSLSLALSTFRLDISPADPMRWLNSLSNFHFPQVTVLLGFLPLHKRCPLFSGIRILHPLTHCLHGLFGFFLPRCPKASIIWVRCLLG